MNLPTDNIYKFITVLGVIIVSICIEYFVSVDAKCSDADISANAAKSEYITLIKQSNEIYTYTRKLYNESILDYNKATELTKQGKIDDANILIAGANLRKVDASKYFEKAQMLANEAQNKEQILNRLETIAQDITSRAKKQFLYSFIIGVIGIILTVYGAILWFKHENKLIR